MEIEATMQLSEKYDKNGYMWAQILVNAWKHKQLLLSSQLDFQKSISHQIYGDGESIKHESGIYEEEYGTVQSTFQKISENIKELESIQIDVSG